MFSTTLLATLSWLGFITTGFVLWSTGNTDGGYSMVGIAIILPAVVAAAIHLARVIRPLNSVPGWTSNIVSTMLLSTLSWLGFIVCGFVLWYYGNTNGGYSMVGIAIILPAVVALGLLVPACRQPPATSVTPLTAGVALLGTLSWLGFLVAGFMLWYFGNTNGGYSMVSIAIILPAVVAAIYGVVGLVRNVPAPPAPAPAVATVDAVPSAATATVDAVATTAAETKTTTVASSETAPVTTAP